MDLLQELLILGTPKKRRRHRGFREWHWDKIGQFKHYSSHWTMDDALENTPANPGHYYLVCGHHGSFVIHDEIDV